jgi:hypothetical protein
VCVCVSVVARCLVLFAVVACGRCSFRCIGMVERSARGFCSRFLPGLCVLRPSVCGTGLKFYEGGNGATLLAALLRILRYRGF